jgi:hypothetical protein
VGAGGAENPKRDRSLAGGDHTARTRAAREADRLPLSVRFASFGPSLRTLAMDEFRSSAGAVPELSLRPGRPRAVAAGAPEVACARRRTQSQPRHGSTSYVTPARTPSHAAAAASRRGCAKRAQEQDVWERVESGRPDLNRRPPAPKAGALPGCATPRRRPEYRRAPTVLTRTPVQSLVAAIQTAG